MSEYAAGIVWERGEKEFTYLKYSRDHSISFGNQRIAASAAPEYYGNPAYSNPEQLFVAAMSSCHMLTFLALAAKKGFLVERYTDNASGEIGKNDAGKHAVVGVRLHPSVEFRNTAVPSEEDYRSLHRTAHEHCFIANSIAACVTVHIEPRMAGTTE